MKIIYSLHFYILALSLFLLYGCSKKNDSSIPEVKTPIVNTESLHLSFKTPDWERNIDCSLLNFTPNKINDTTNIIQATSASTAESFCLSYPIDSSSMINSANLKRYKIMSIYDNNAPFQFSQKLPLDENSLNDLTKKLISIEALTANEYNEIQEIKYLGSETLYTVFLIKGKYEMNMYLSGTPSIIMPVSGSYAFKIRTKRI